MGNCVCAQLRTRADQQSGENKRGPNFGPDHASEAPAQKKAAEPQYRHGKAPDNASLLRRVWPVR
ncbi:hypothetical protein GCM10010862_00980 [Devosia nitrariae]|uniref:Uncharacterized protein n=1 Tax=Devosia nitrariae TaxID=2071872 RepID=A0ABQ5VZI5_9HYPH|nr:hypothetical protein GCM10010862_00980 [Devosia nitrariae]